MTGNEWIGPAIIAAGISATISAVVTATGWIVSSRREATRAEALRSERVLDVQIALRAEIWAHLYQLEADDLDEITTAINARFAADDGFAPLIVREEHDAIYRALIGDIQVLSTDAIRPVVFYYAQVSALRLFAEDLRSADFASRSGKAKALMFTDYMEMKRKARDMAKDAVTALSQEIDRAAVNRPGAGPSDRI